MESFVGLVYSIGNGVIKPFCQSRPLDEMKEKRFNVDFPTMAQAGNPACQGCQVGLQGSMRMIIFGSYIVSFLFSCVSIFSSHSQLARFMYFLLFV